MNGTLRRVGRKLVRLFNPGPAGADEKELARLRSLPRHTATTTHLLGPPVLIPDGPSVAAGWAEIFQRRIYEFATNNPAPLIIDCGANVGLATVFFKRLYPASRVLAFEPDPQIFGYLEKIIAATGLRGVQTFRKAVWSSTGPLHFLAEGADGGRVADVAGHQSPVIEIDAIRLQDFLREPVDLLKLDVEGAETEVLRDCADSLGQVENLFVEYHSFSAQPQSLDELLALLRRAGFRVQIQPVGFAPQPFVKVDPHLGMDLQLNIFAYRRESGD